MGKTKDAQLIRQDYEYDEASSGSDSSSDEDENEEEFDRRVSTIERISKSDDDKESDESNSESSIGNSSGSESDSEESVVEQEGRIDNGIGNDESSSDEEDAPLRERVLRKEGRGLRKQFSIRERKSKALEEATKRLASLKEEKQRKRKEMGEDEGDEKTKTVASAPRKKRKNKHKPTEVSSKRADFYSRGAWRLNESGLGVDIGAHKYKPNDPRVSNLSGHFDEDRFQSNYSFLEELRNKEIGQVRKRIAAHKATGNKGNRMRRKVGITQADGSHSSTLEEDVARLKALTQARADLERKKIDRAAKRSVKRKIREDVESGKTGAYFLKRKEKKRLELEARFEEIRKRGGEKAVEKMLAKKRKKNKSRDASFLSR